MEKGNDFNGIVACGRVNDAVVDCAGVQGASDSTLFRQTTKRKDSDDACLLRGVRIVQLASRARMRRRS